MKVAIVHDYLKEIGGAERVLMAIKEIFPDADIYTAMKFPRYWGQFREKMEKWNIQESWAKWIPFREKFLSYLTVVSPWFFKWMDLSNYDLVVVSQTGGYFPNGVKIGSKTKLITYCHTPPRFLYGYPTASKEREKWYWKSISNFVNLFLRYIDFQFAQRPHLFIANSKNVRNRVNKFYRREAEVVYPPIENLSIKSKPNRGDYYLVLSRLVGSKNIELAIEAAEKKGFELRVAGRAIGNSGEEIVNKIGNSKNTKYLGEVSDSEKAELMAGAKALFCLETDADFGMTPIEAQSLGTPVIAYRGGGYLESIVENKTGVFFGELTVESLLGAIERFDEKKITEKNCIENAKGFSKENFERRIKELIGKV